MADEPKNLLEGYSPEDIALMATAYASIVTNPDTREATLRLQKKVNPKARLPEIDLKDAITAATADQQKKIDDQASRQIEMEARERIRDERDKLKGQGFSDTDVAEIEKEMIESKKAGTHLTYESAARYYKGLKAMAVPSSAPHATDLNNTMPEDALQAFQKGGRAGLTKLTRERAGKALDDVLGGRIKLH